MKHLVLAIACLGFVGCKSSTTSTTAVPVLQSIEGSICDAATEISTDLGGQVVTSCQGTGTAAACGAAFIPALLNSSFCANSQVASITSAQIKQKKASAAAMKAMGIKPQGIIASLGCPIAVPVFMGYLTAAIPAACGCTVNIGASALDPAMVAFCETLPF